MWFIVYGSVSNNNEITLRQCYCLEGFKRENMVLVMFTKLMFEFMFMKRRGLNLMRRICRLRNFSRHEEPVL